VERAVLPCDCVLGERTTRCLHFVKSCDAISFLSWNQSQCLSSPEKDAYLESNHVFPNLLDDACDIIAIVYGSCIGWSPPWYLPVLQLLVNMYEKYEESYQDAQLPLDLSLTLRP